MKGITSLDINDAKEFLLAIAPQRTVFIWGAPGIGKSSLIEQFSKDVGLECVTLLGSQLAPEDLIGIPQIQGDVSRFVPPSLIVRDKAFCLFIDEINIAVPEVQKAFYSLILDKRIGEYKLPKGSIVIGAGNRSADSALVKKMPSALINRMIHIELKVNHRIWLDWANNNQIHQWVSEYIQTRPSHLSSAYAPTSEEPFSTPRSWAAVSEGLIALGDEIQDNLLEALLFGSLSSEHATSFKAFIKQLKHRFNLSKIINGDEKWPSAPEDRDILLFLVNSLRDHLLKELPKNVDKLNSEKNKLVMNIKGSLKELSRIDSELAQFIISPNEADEILPTWFLTEISKELPKLIQKKEDKK